MLENNINYIFRIVSLTISNLVFMLRLKEVLDVCLL